MRVLEVGTGSGYQAAVLADLVGPSGRVVTLERIGSLAQAAARALAAGAAATVEVHHSDGSIGYPQESPYDRIVVTAAAPRIPPPLLEQLALDGILLVPVGRTRCDLQRVRKKVDGWTTESLGACAFVPLRGLHGQDQPPFAS